MTPLSAFGLFAVTAMLVSYALEQRSSWFVLAFAVACALGSAYGFLRGAWPFGVVERSGRSLQSAAGGTRSKSPTDIAVNDPSRLEGLTQFSRSSIRVRSHVAESLRVGQQPGFEGGFCAT